MSSDFKLKTMKDNKIELGSLVRVIKLNKSGVVLGRISNKKWLVTFPNKVSLPYSESELEINNID